MFEAEKARIEKINADATAEIKGIIIQTAKKLGKKFPMMEFGVRDNKEREGCVVEGMISDVDVTVYATKRMMPGIKLASKDGFWTDSWEIILTPDGIFECGYVMSEPADADKIRKSGCCVTIDTRPDWERKYES